MSETRAAIGTVVKAAGTAFAESDGGKRPLAEGGKVFEGETIVTADGGKVEIRFKDDTLLSQGENSRIELDEYVFGGDKGAASLMFNMVEGSFRTVTGKIVEQNPEGFNLSSPLATIGIRGTTTFHSISRLSEKHGVQDIENPSLGGLDSPLHGMPQGFHTMIVRFHSGDQRVISDSYMMVEMTPSGMGMVRLFTQNELRDYIDLSAFTPEERRSLSDQLFQEYREVAPTDPRNAPPASDTSGEGSSDTQAQPPQAFQFSQEQSQQSTIEVPPELIPLLTGIIPAAVNEQGDLDRSWLETLREGVRIENFLTRSAGESLPGNLVVTLMGSDGNDTIFGSNASERILGLAGDDMLYGNGGNDTLLGGEDDDSLDGGDGNDFLDGGAGDDTINGGEGQDTVSYADSSTGWTIDLFGSAQMAWANDESEMDFLFSIEHVMGSSGDDSILGSEGDNILKGLAGDDTIMGNAGNDSLYGGDGDDTLDGGSGNNYLDGGSGDNWVSYASIQEIYEDKGVVVYLGSDGDYSGYGMGTRSYPIYDESNGNVTGFYAEYDYLANIRNVEGSMLSDTIEGNDFGNYLKGLSGNDYIWGGGGNDTIDGGGGDDFISGGSGQDTLTGGEGADTFLYFEGDGLYIEENVASAGVQGDYITDFASGEDMLLLEGWDSYLESSIISDFNFFCIDEIYTGTNVNDSNGSWANGDACLIYDYDSEANVHRLIYDSNGSGAGESTEPAYQILATFSGSTELQAEDISLDYLT